ncbi:sorcin isoform X2 [Aquila chrysaetos chrysaetos]|uniref:sorcin isoform X2 n=1 Tax=Aquila chrysaetos chrysaetos TaxID=223781 RepID=UPI001B7D3610|nr:sorcin isoform X2 [Aquila chrysaetos chrysaetos]
MAPGAGQPLPCLAFLPLRAHCGDLRRPAAVGGAAVVPAAQAGVGGFMGSPRPAGGGLSALRPARGSDLSRVRRGSARSARPPASRSPAGGAAGAGPGRLGAPPAGEGRREEAHARQVPPVGQSHFWGCRSPSRLPTLSPKRGLVSDPACKAVFASWGREIAKRLRRASMEELQEGQRSLDKLRILCMVILLQ